MRFRHSFWTVGLAVITLGLAACSDRSTIGPTPTDRFDVATLEASLATMERVASTPVLESFKALGQHVGSVSVGSSSPAAPFAAEPADAAGRLVRLVSRIAGLAGSPSGAQFVPIIRSAVLGRTYVYDPVTKQYVIDPARTGAPANGVRFILYQLDEETRSPSPGAEIGWVDLIDEKASSTSSLGLRLRVVSGGTTYLEYAFELGGQLVSPTVAVSGFLSDGTERLDFDLAVSGQIGQSGAVRLDARLEIPSREFKVTASARGTEGEGQMDLMVEGGDDVISMKARVEDDQLNATFTVNGRLLATATGDPHHPVIVGEGGRELTVEEQAALAQIVGLAEGLFRLFGELLEPVGALLGLGVVL